MSLKYKHLLSPYKIGNTVFRNRFICARSSPHNVQGNETFANDAIIFHYANKARNGAALVTCSGVGMPHIIPDALKSTYTAKTVLPGNFNIDNPADLRSVARLALAIHFYGARASMQIGGYVPLKYDVSPGILSLNIGLDTSRTGEEIPAGLLDEVVADFVRQASALKKAGFDMVYLHMAYRFTILGRFLSPLTNKRTDKFGGSLENRARFPIMVADAIKAACGSDFLIEACISGVEPQGGNTLEDTIKLAGMFAGHIDMLQVRAGDIDPAHPTGFERQRTPFLYLAEAIKKSNPGLAIATVGGYQDLDVSEDVIASGKADFIAMARGWISNTEYGRLAYEGRNEDVVPCIRCNLCLAHFRGDVPLSTCSVNPTWGLEDKIHSMVKPPAAKKKVAIAGGGPAGLQAALVAAKRGHSVTLYEKSPALGGLLRTMEGVSFKWPQREYRDYLVRQVNKSGVRVLLNTEATPALLQKGKYDVVLAAVGARPVVPPIPGIEGSNVFFAADIYGREGSLAHDVVVIGGGEVGVETGMHLAEKGHHVTLLEMRDMLAPSAPPVHYYDMLKEAWEKLPGFNYVLQARCTGIGKDQVTYIKPDGSEHSVPAGSVVVAAGMCPDSDLAMKLGQAGVEFYAIGDCSSAGNIQKAVLSAFSIASGI